MVVTCDVLFNREVVEGGEGLAVVGGHVSYDRAASRLASASVTLAEPTRLPVSSADILTPFGYEARLWRGVMINGVAETVPLGTFPIQRSHVGALAQAAELTLEDRSRLASDARLEDVYQIAAGTNYATAIEDLIDDGVTGLEYLFPSTTHTTPLLTFDAQSDRWDTAQRMTRSLGHWLWFDGLGRTEMRAEPSFSDVPVATISDGVNLVDAAIDLDRTDTYNKVIAAGRNADNGSEFTGSATDDDPASPTYYDGPFGKKPRFHFSEFYNSSAQAAEGAAAILASQLGVARSLAFTQVSDPRLEVGDVVEIYNEVLEVDELHILDSLTIGLGPGDPVTGTTRTRQVTS
jgi:hypothetical protein